MINPLQFIEKMMIGNTNPMIGNLMQMAKGGNKDGVEKFARNFCKERGVNFDEEFSKFMSGIKR